MNGFLRQSTASQSRLIGPFVNDVDFITAETGLTIANTDIKLRANGTTLSNKNSGGGTHQVNGMYSVTWDATDTANVGELFYSVKVTDAMQVFGSYTVVEEAVYDAMFASSAAMASTLTSTERDAVADALLDRSNGVETGLTPRNAMRLIAAACAGKLSGAATTTVVVRNAIADSKNRISATVDADGNRSAITTDLT